LNKFNESYSNLNNINKKVIYNYINKENVIEKANKEDAKFNNDKINFVTVARLVEQKGIDRVIEVHNKLIKEGLLHNFYVIGDGQERQKLEDMIQKYGISNTFKLLGKKENPYPYIKDADYFCLLSKFEGYGMVLEEAKILDKSIIITDTAAREAIEKYKNSKILDNNEEGIYKGIKEVVKSQKIGFYSNEKQIENYDNNEIIEKVIELIEK